MSDPKPNQDKADPKSEPKTPETVLLTAEELRTISGGSNPGNPTGPRTDDQLGHKPTRP